MYNLFIGRYQPLHEGHVKLIRTVLDEGKKVCIALRKEDGTKDNPYTQQERLKMFEKEFYKEISGGNLEVVFVPNVTTVCHGRKVGWGVREIKLDTETESISATKIRRGE